MALANLAAFSRGSQVEEMSVRRMADLAGQVVIGRVSAVRTYWAENPRRIESEITLAQIEYAKGAPAGATDAGTFVVPGGTVGDWTLRVSGAPEFAVGEKWMLFVLPTYKTHPVVGLYRGAFRVVADAAGVERVLDAERQPIKGIDARGMVVSVEADPSTAEWADRHSSPQVTALLAAANDSVSAMAFSDFRAAIQPVLERSQDHHLSGPAGRREVVTHTPVVLSTPGERKFDATTEWRGASGAVPRQDVPRSPSVPSKGRQRR